VKGTTKLVILYKKGDYINLIAYTDNGFVGDLDDQNNTFSFVFLLSFELFHWLLRNNL